jgi:hypothetical protein
MKLFQKIGFILSIWWLCSCGTDATRFDISKKLPFTYALNQIETFELDTLLSIDIKKNPEMKSYSDFTEAYFIKSISYAIAPLTDNTASELHIVVFLVLENEEVAIFDKDNISLTNWEEMMPIESQRLEQISNEISTSGPLKIHVQIAADMIPASYSFSLIFDTTVAVDFKK